MRRRSPASELSGLERAGNAVRWSLSLDVLDPNHVLDPDSCVYTEAAMGPMPISPRSG